MSAPVVARPASDIDSPHRKAIDPRGDELWWTLDRLHGQVLRAKYRLDENPDHEVLGRLVADISALAASVGREWRAYEKATS